MKIVSWNVNGIRAVQKKGFREWLECESPDILCLQEVKALPEQFDHEIQTAQGYLSAWNPSRRKGYSGVAVFYKNPPESIGTSMGLDHFDSEGRLLILNYPDFTLLNVYFPNSGQGEHRLQFKLDFYEHIIAYCSELTAQGRKIIICGDFNTAHREIDLKNPQSNRYSPGFLPVERAMLDRFLAAGYTDVFRYFYPDRVEYTWWDYRTRARERNAGWRIDCFYVTHDLLDRVVDCMHLTEVHGSDHCPITLILEMQQ